jgi:hypothetical protein
MSANEPRPQIFTMTHYDFVEGMLAKQGICMACGDMSQDGIDHDALEDLCEACGQHAVFGYATGLMSGRIRCKDKEVDDGENDDS